MTRHRESPAGIGIFQRNRPAFIIHPAPEQARHESVTGPENIEHLNRKAGAGFALVKRALFGLTALAYMWAQIAKLALTKAEGGDPYYATKLVTARYYVERVLPETTAHLAKLKTGAATLMALDAEAF